MKTHTASSTPYGPVIRALALLSGTDETTTALNAAAILGCLAGPQGGMMTLGGEIQKTRFHLLNIVANDARTQRLLNLLTLPVDITQESLRCHSQNASPALVEELASSFNFPTIADQYPDDGASRDAKYRKEYAAWILIHRLSGMSTSCVGVRDPWSDHRSRRRIGQYDNLGLEEPLINAESRRHLAEPSFMATNPSAKQMLEILSNTDQQHLLALDHRGDLLENLLPKDQRSRDSSQERLLEGTDIVLTKSRRPGTATRASVTLVGSTQLKFIARILSQGKNRTCGLPSGFLLVRPSSLSTPIDGDSTLSESDQKHYEHYRDTIQRLLLERRFRGSFHDLAMDPQESTQFFSGQRDFLNQLDSIDEAHQPWVRGLAHLPAALLFGLKAINFKQEAPSLVEASLTLATSAMQSHLMVLKEAQLLNNGQNLEESKEAMLRKLIDIAPCSFRDLLRRYSQQRAAVHRPALDSLIAEGKVEETSDGLLIPVSVLGSRN